MHIFKNIGLKPRLLALAAQPEVLKKYVLPADCEKKHTFTSTTKSINFGHAIARTMVKAGKRKQSSHHKRAEGLGSKFSWSLILLVTYIT